MADHGTDESAPARWNALGPDSNMWMNWDDDHMIEEYARHAGHADLLRERVDGRVGQ